MLRLKKTATSKAASSALSPIVPTDRSQSLPLSWGQQRMWFLDQLDSSAGNAYHMPLVLRLSGPLDTGALRATLDRLVARHENLRTTFVLQDGLPVQLVGPAEGARFTLLEHDLSALADQARQSEIERLGVDVFGPFDLAQGPLIRGQLLRLDDTEHLLQINQHHIISDGWSLAVLVREVQTLYAALSRGQADPLAPLAIQYADYAVWQREWLQGATLQAQADYWKRHLTGAPELLSLPTDRARPALQSHAGASLAFNFPAPLSAAIKALGQRHGATFFMTMLAGWGLLLSRLSGQSEVVIGSPIANRQRREVESLIGFFVNTLALRLNIESESSVAALLAQVKALTLDAYAHQDIPFEQVVEAVKPTRSLSHSPLFQTTLTLNEAVATGGAEVDQTGLLVRGVEQAHTTAQFDLQLLLSASGSCISGTLVYASALFDAATAERMLGHLQTLMQSMVEDEQREVSRLALLSAAEHEQLVKTFNDTAQAYPADKLIHQLFEERLAEHGQATALETAEESLSYAELNARANQLAHALIAMGVKPDERVAICARRGVPMVVGLLGILKAGGAYVPLDPDYPAERLAYMLGDCAPAVLLTTDDVLDNLPASSLLRVLVLDAEPSLARRPTHNPNVAGLTSRHLAYVMFTSGSTGQPKGVMVEHRNVLRLVVNNPYARITAADCIAHCASPAFDASTWELWAALLNGARVLLVSQEALLDPRKFNETLLAGRVSALWLTAGLFNEYLDALKPAFASLRLLMVGGDVLDPRSVARALLAPAPGQLINGYGPTETTTFAITHLIEAVAADARSIPLGRPIGNTQVYLLDAHLQPVPLGVAGEIHIGGDGVARGYFNQPALTEERFLLDPFSAQAGARMYKSGDLGRWLADGTIEYLGRNDFQIKIRGFRIEPGEIEAQLVRCEGVKEAVVLAREDVPGEKRLVAYLTGTPGSAAELRSRLSAQLAEYMLPAAFVTLEQFPLTPNGKLDRQALPAPGMAAVAARAYQAPQGEVEAALARIWSELLAVEQVGREDNFFELGGHSLLAVQLMSRIRSDMGVEIGLRDLFAQPTLAAFAGQVAQARQSTLGTIPLADRSVNQPLSLAQQRLWFLDQLDAAAGAAYHMTAGLRLSGELDTAALKATLDRIVARHEILRTTFAISDGEPVQHIGRADIGFALDEQDLSELGAADQQDAIAAASAAFFAQPFVLADGPLIRARLIRLADSEHLLFICNHHIISDGWSLGVLVREVSALYTAFSQGRDDPLAPLAIQYADYAAWQRGHLQGETLQAQVDYWKGHLADAPELLALPTDHPRPAVQSYTGAHLPVQLPAALSEGIKQLSARHGVTVFMTLLGAWGILMARMSGQGDVVIGSPIANRQRSEIENLIGFFVNTLALRVDSDGEPSVAELLERVKTLTLNAYAHQDIPFEQVVEALKPARSLSHSPLFQTMFTWNQATTSEAHQLPGLRMAPIAHAASASQFDVSLSLSEGSDGIGGALEYATDLFEADSMRRLLGYFQNILEGMVADPAQAVSRLALVGAA
ncbi:amino acid adenylation domain-containing protein, partial [Rugamonas sp. CCM 8940]